MADSGGGSSAWTVALVGILGAVLGALVSGGFNYLAHQGDLDAKMIELSVGILRSEPTPETGPLREWAIDVIDKRAKFPFNAAQRAVLLTKQLPFLADWVFSDIPTIDRTKTRQAPPPGPKVAPPAPQ
jgi:hypothetical protein